VLTSTTQDLTPSIDTIDTLRFPSGPAGRILPEVRRTASIALFVLLAGAPTLAAVEPESLAVDAGRSRVRIHLGRTGFLKFLGRDHEIDAPIAEGRVVVAVDDPARSSVRLRFEARRLAVVPGSEPAGDIPKVEARMRGPEVLDVDRYPEIVFASSSVAAEAIAPGRYRLRVRGTLELKGRSFAVEVRLEVGQARGEVQARGDVEWRLSDLGIEPPSVAGVVRVANEFGAKFEITARP
jgi:polyisoprenoid-binding protein YceI